MKIYGTIYYKMLPTHPDVDHVFGGWKPEEEYDFGDIYTFDETWEKETAIEYVKRDLKLVAGGGYNWEHIKDVSFDLEVVE